MKIAFLLPAYFGSNHSMFLGVGYLAASVKSEGNEAIIIDEDAIRWIYAQNDEEASLYLAEKRVVQEIGSYNPDILCMSINTANYKNALRMLKYIREKFRGAYMVVGGPHISTCYYTFREWHKDLFDAAIIGEGEAALCALVSNLKRGKVNSVIPGVCYSNSERIFMPQKMLDINSIPFPDREAFFTVYSDAEKVLAKKNYERVFYSHLPGFENSHARVVASRGCFNGCAFCSPGLFWRDPETGRPFRRVRSPKSIADEIEGLLSKGIRSIYFDDPTFPIKSNFVFFREFEREILERNLHFNWGAPVCSSEIDSGILDRLQNIGFSYTYFGLESCKEKNLTDFHKRQDIRSCLELIHECKARGIHCDASYQIGLPHETIDDIKESIDWIFASNIERNTFFSITAIWPETELAQKYGVMPCCYEPCYDRYSFEKVSGLFFFEQGNPVLENFYSNCSGTYHFISPDEAIEMKYYIFDSGLSNRFARKGSDRR